MNPLYTIGHSTHELPRFLELLRQHGIQEVADVRSQPYSRHTPGSARAAGARLKVAGVAYVFLGRELGARRTETDCYVAAKSATTASPPRPAFAPGWIAYAGTPPRCASR